MGKKVDLTGMRFGRWTALQRCEDRRYRCRCDCGEVRSVNTDNLRSGRSRSCGCLRAETTSAIGKRGVGDIVGMRFGNTTVVEVTDQRVGRHVVFGCVCDCGTVHYALGHNLKSGQTYSCGCTRLIDHDGHRFRSRWELYWYLGAKKRGLDVEYESVTLDVTMPDGRVRKYTPDFLIPSALTMVEIKGRKWTMGMKKNLLSNIDGHRVGLWFQEDLESWCGCTVAEMQRANSVGGIDAVRDLINARIVYSYEPDHVLVSIGGVACR